MTLEDIQQVMEVERESFPTMWPQTAFKQELQQNRLAHYLVTVEAHRPEAAHKATPEPMPSEIGLEGGALRRLLSGLRHKPDGRERQQLPAPGERPESVLGFVGVWLLADEAHIVTVAVRESHRRRGIGEMLLIAAIEIAQESGQGLVTLECRVSNTPAIALYEKYGFQQVGLRPRYYSDNHEDAYVLSVSPVTSQRYRNSFQRLKEEHKRRCGDYEIHL